MFCRGSAGCSNSVLQVFSPGCQGCDRDSARVLIGRRRACDRGSTGVPGFYRGSPRVGQGFHQVLQGFSKVSARVGWASTGVLQVFFRDCDGGSAGVLPGVLPWFCRVSPGVRIPFEFCRGSAQVLPGCYAPGSTRALPAGPHPGSSLLLPGFYRGSAFVLPVLCQRSAGRCRDSTGSVARPPPPPAIRSFAGFSVSSAGAFPGWPLFCLAQPGSRVEGVYSSEASAFGSPC